MAAKSQKHRLVFQFVLRNAVIAGPAVLEYESDATRALDIFREGEDQLHVPAIRKKIAKQYPDYGSLLKTKEGQEQLQKMQVQAFPLEPKAERHLSTIK